MARAATGRSDAKFAREVAAGDLQAEEEIPGSLVVELIAGDEGQDLGEGELDSRAVLDGGQLEFGLIGVDPEVPGSGAARGVVVVAELLAAQGW